MLGEVYKYSYASGESELLAKGFDQLCGVAVHAAKKSTLRNWVLAVSCDLMAIRSRSSHQGLPSLPVSRWPMTVAVLSRNRAAGALLR
ncbi:hypothetical protein ACFSTD_01205 [Novosphingobium colocasiae]